MSFWIKFILFVIYFDIKSFVSEFVSIGEYPDYKDLDINHPLCGLSTVPFRYTLNYPVNCFRNKYKNKTLLVSERYQDKSEQISNRIFQGENAGFSESPWTVLVDTPKGFCTGVLITFQWVLTASHCYRRPTEQGQFFPKPGFPRPSWPTYIRPYELIIGVGYERYNWIEVRHAEPDNFYSHPNYSDPYADIALIKVNTPFTKHRKEANHYVINTICLSKSGEHNIHSDYGTYYGFGFVEGTTRYTKYLQKARVLLRPFGNCSSKTSMFCSYFASPQDPRPCLGDSGGPLVQQIHSKRQVLIGVHKSSKMTINSTCSVKTTYSDWTPVPNFIDWILNTIRENS